MFLKRCRLRFPKGTFAYSKLLVIGILVPALLAPGFAFSQSRKELEERRKRLQQEIRQTSTQLKATRDKEAATLRRYLTLQRQIRSREELVENLRSEIEFVDQRIVRTLEVLEALESDATRLQKEYSAMLRVAMRQKLNQSALLFLFSAKSMNDAFRRWQFLRQFERYRARQARLILETQRTLSEKTTSLAERRKEKQQMLGTLQVEQVQLQGELAKKNDLLRSLKSDERKLAGELGRQQEAQNKLNNAIESIIQQEIAALRKRTRSAEPGSGKSEGSSLEASRFGQYQGSLPWPLQGGTIVRTFGTQQHPRFKDVKTQSNGIDIRANSDLSVRAVYDGRVVGVRAIPGSQNTLIVQHGAYYTVYSNLAEVWVQRDNQVSANQEIGRLGRSEPELHFEIWREQSKLNPAAWISRN